METNLGKAQVVSIRVQLCAHGVKVNGGCGRGRGRVCRRRGDSGCGCGRRRRQRMRREEGKISHKRPGNGGRRRECGWRRRGGGNSGICRQRPAGNRTGKHISRRRARGQRGRIWRCDCFYRRRRIRYCRRFYRTGCRRRGGRGRRGDNEIINAPCQPQHAAQRQPDPPPGRACSLVHAGKHVMPQPGSGHG